MLWLSLLHAFISLYACCLCLLTCGCVLVQVILLLELSFMCLFNLHVCTLLLLVLDFYGISCYRNSYMSSCSCFSPRNFSFSLCLKLKNNARGVMNDGGIIGKLQVRLLVPFSFFYFCFSQYWKTVFSCIFSWIGKNYAWGVMQA